MNFLARLKNLDWVLNSAIIFLVAASLISLSGSGQYFYRQFISCVIAFAIIIVFSQIDWRSFLNYSWIIQGLYYLSVVLLVFTYFAAPTIRGIKGWIVLGPLQFQASEFSKIALIIMLSAFWAKAHVGVAHKRNIFLSLIYFAVPAFLVMIQPDLGSVIILFAIWFSYLLISGIKWKHLLAAFVIFIFVGIFLWTSFLKDYQRERIIDFFNPGRDPLGVSYNVIQSKIAIGSAGFFGKGFGQGTQLRLGFLPEPRTDFILAAFIEEWGLLGGLLAVGAFLIILLRIIKIGLVGENNFFRLFCLGAVIMFLAHFILNAGSNLGIFPVVGVPFPFFSYGGSNLLTSAFIIGIIQSILLKSR
ncbi:MAG: FtsW/RodA/SpoVE family cell cycle protein [Candidatus Pacebacteria bacterium]|nr:FtsW/RodA/SpoVE family cell cycle protein [Candidatus Paceibacterota bacterium]